MEQPESKLVLCVESKQKGHFRGPSAGHANNFPLNHLSLWLEKLMNIGLWSVFVIPIVCDSAMEYDHNSWTSEK